MALAPCILGNVRPASAFCVARSNAVLPGFFHDQQPRSRSETILWEKNRAGSPDDGSYEAGCKKEKCRKRLTAIRVGGRSVKPKELSNTKDARQNGIQRYLVPCLIGLLLSWSFGGTASNNYYYSYSSYSVETSSYNNNGLLDIQRQESTNIKSNIPGLRNNPSILSNLQENQRLLEEQEHEYLDAFSNNMIRAIEEILDESWE